MIYITMLRMSLSDKYTKQQVYEKALEKAKETKDNDIIQAFDMSSLRTVHGKDKGWCLHALWCAVYGLMKFETYKDAIDAIICMGGDTDTNASIAGALLGAYYGNKIMENNDVSDGIRTILECETSAYCGFSDLIAKVDKAI